MTLTQLLRGDFFPGAILFLVVLFMWACVVAYGARRKRIR